MSDGSRSTDEHDKLAAALAEVARLRARCEAHTLREDTLVEDIATYQQAVCDLPFVKVALADAASLREQLGTITRGRDSLFAEVQELRAQQVAKPKEHLASEMARAAGSGRRPTTPLSCDGFRALNDDTPEVTQLKGDFEKEQRRADALGEQLAAAQRAEAKAFAEASNKSHACDDWRRIAKENAALMDGAQKECERLRAVMRESIRNLDTVWAGINDRLLAKGPLSQAYAWSVSSAVQMVQKALGDVAPAEPAQPPACECRVPDETGGNRCTLPKGHEGQHYADHGARLVAEMKAAARPPMVTPGPVASFDLRDLRIADQARQAEWDKAGGITLSYRGNELAGEVGEACNVIKKLERERLGIRGSRATVAQLADELADVVICSDLIAGAEGIDLGAAIVRKFNETSEKVGLATRLGVPAAPPAQTPPTMKAALQKERTDAAEAWLAVERQAAQTPPTPGKCGMSGDAKTCANNCGWPKSPCAVLWPPAVLERIRMMTPEEIRAMEPAAQTPDPATHPTRMWRTLIRIEHVDALGFLVVVPAFDTRKRILVDHALMLRLMQADGLGGTRLHAMANIGADKVSGLQFEPCPAPTETPAATPDDKKGGA